MLYTLFIGNHWVTRFQRHVDVILELPVNPKTKKKYGENFRWKTNRNKSSNEKSY